MLGDVVTARRWAFSFSALCYTALAINCSLRLLELLKTRRVYGVLSARIAAFGR